MLALALAAGCKGTPTSPTKKTGATPLVVDTKKGTTPAPVVPVIEAVPATLTGKVKLLSNNGGSLVSDHGAGVISNNAGNVVSNNGSSYHVLADAAPAEVLLADAEIRVEDAKGAAVLDGAGKPLVAKTDLQGGYRFTAALPPGNVVLRVKLWQGGELSALLPHTADKARDQVIDTATTLGAAFVLGKYVKGDQATFDKLPAAQAEKLRADLDAARGNLTAVPKYQADELVALTEGLQAKVPAVASRLEEIKVLLLGQANLGNGRAGDHVAIYNPRGVTVDAQNNLIFGEPSLGRIRRVAPDGTITMVADVLRGTVKRNFPDMQSIVVAPDGGLYVAAGAQVFHVTAAGEVVAVAGVAPSVPGGAAAASPTGPITPFRLALAKDGTLYIGESGVDADSVPRVLALHPDGSMSPLTIDAGWAAGGSVAGLAAEPDGGLVVLYYPGVKNAAKLYRYRAEAATVVADALGVGRENAGLARGADGTLYVSEPGPDRVSAIAPDGTRRVVAGKGGPAATQDLQKPANVAVGPDGTLYIGDTERAMVFALRPDGSWQIRAGVRSAVGAACATCRSTCRLRRSSTRRAA
ncbi:MAG: serine/threonine protein kinase [Cyanobacteria bacterium RYN_339]|nr:serine/threonine protein kinase [Cyanobacteria bacterium RYN_339]